MKRLVLCCDGTWNSADQEHDGEPCPTNIVRFAYRVAKRDKAGVPQIVYYDQGVGTGNTIDRLSGGAIGKGLEENIHDAYRFLLANYEHGDELFILGFSRGAFTARSIVGMIRKCGILARKHVRHYRAAIELYRDDAKPTDDGPVKFRKDFCLYGTDDIDVRFIGVWDTVGALGIPIRGLRLLKKQYQFHDTELSKVVREAYHALAVDEYRAPFEPAVWDYVPKDAQRVEQVWFCGAHSDVGGGYGRKKRDSGAGADADFHPQLADISLDWMIGKAQSAGLEFDEESVKHNPLQFDPLAEIHDSKTGLYNFVPSFDRVIGITEDKYVENGTLDPTQSLHPSVLERWDRDPTYRPESLLRYFRLIHDPRADEELDSELKPS
jgi:uncharacterized protein (DUF2235 family)